MAKLSLSLDERTERNGMQQIRLRITNKGTNAFAGTGVWVEPQYFAKYSLYDPIRGKAYMAAEKREQVRLFVKRFEDVMSAMDPVELDQLMASEIKAMAVGAKSVPNRDASGVSNKNASSDFLRWFEQYGESRRTAKTQESYAYGLKVLRAYCDARHLWTLSIGEIDYARVSDFGRWLGESKGDATRHMLECYVRAAYKEAQKHHMVSRDRDPYYDYSIKPVPVKDIECLTAKQMHILMTATMPNKSTQMGLDAALMSFFLCGANLVDLYEMPKAKAGHVEFVRHKVNGRWQKTVQIRIEPEMRAFIERYSSDNRLLRFSALYGNYESFRHKIGHRLRDVSKVVGFDVNLAMIRRTWATIAAEIGCPDAVIDMCLGHIPQTVNRKHYVKPKWENAAEWNRRVIDYVLSA